MEHAWGLSTQSAAAWFVDQARSLGVGLVMGLVPAIAFFGLVHLFPRTWWVWGWAVFSVLTILFAFLWPILIAPLFNTFTPLEEGPLRGRVVELAAEAGVALDDVLVADASKRTTAENAYVAGLGSSKRMVLYDTLLEGGDADETAYVAAHELGHDAHDHIWKFVALTSAALLVGFGALWWLSRTSVWEWSQASGIGDARALPLLALFSLVAGFLFLPVQNLVSRSFERSADRVAIELTEDPVTAVKVYRRLAFSNLADLRPPRIAVWTLFSHPPIPERIENVLDASRRE
jgi:STE24 endopeptidase